MEVLLIIVFIVILTIQIIVEPRVHINKIELKIDSMNSRLIEYEKRTHFDGIGPFIVIDKGKTIYKISYEYNGERKEGWVRFGGIDRVDWRF